MSDLTEELVKSLSKIDALAEEILMDRHLDAKRNKCREAYRRLTHGNCNSKNTWVCFGNTFIKMETEGCIEMLKTDQTTIDKEINSLRDGLKPKVSKLHQMEGRSEVKGFNLKGTKKEELFSL